jgi:putative aminopeptidase FrvX
MFANGLGNRIGLAVVLETLKSIPKPENLCVVFSAQKRLGARGIQAFFGENSFDRVITVDAVPCGNGIKSGDGCALVVMDKAGVTDTGFRTELETVALKNELKAKVAVTETDLCMGYIITSGTGAACAAVGVPVRHKDKNFECVEKVDFDEAVKFLSAVIADI